EAAALRREGGEAREDRRREDATPVDRNGAVDPAARAPPPDDATVPSVKRDHAARVVPEVKPVADECRARRDLHAAVEDPARLPLVKVERVHVPVRRAEI